MKYVNQLAHPDIIYVTHTANPDPVRRERGKSTTIAQSGCGVCCAVMIADRLLIAGDFGLQEAIQLSYDSNANYRAGTDAQVYFPAFAEKMGLHYENSQDPDDLLRCLRTGGAAIVKCSGDREGYKGVFSDKDRHYIVAVSEERDGHISVLDPAYEDGGYEREERKGKVEVREPGLGICSMQVLKEETCTLDRPFYLFWRI